MSTASHFVSVSAALKARKDDPLRYWRFAVPQLKEALGLFVSDDPIDELYARACNKGTKTESLAAYVLACLQKRETLDGLPIPTWRGPVEGAQLVLDYKQQLLSVQPAYERLLGSWPCHARYQGEVMTSLRVKPIGASDDQSTWSVLHFLTQENKRSGVGVRGDVIAFDEPPVIEILRELRKAAHAHRRGIIVIGATPEIRRQWAPLLADYGDGPRGRIRRIDRERAEVRWSLEDVADFVLPANEKAKLLRKWAKDPLLNARQHGDYTNTEGKCPFDEEVIVQMLLECVEPRIVPWKVSRETLDEDGVVAIETVPVEVFGDPEAGRRYHVVIDPASGIDDGAHNPACMHISEDGTADLKVRWNGYLEPYSVGVMAAGWARQYNNAPVDVEMKDHWGVNVVRGCQQGGRYGNLAYERRELRPGHFAREVGFDQNEQTKAVIIGCIQEWLSSWRGGVRYGKCQSRAVLNCMLDTELDVRGKIVALKGIDHGEDMICRGQNLRRCIKRSGRAAAYLISPEVAEGIDDRMAQMIRGEISPEELDGGVISRRTRDPLPPCPIPIPRLRA